MSRHRRLGGLIQELNDDLARKLGTVIRYNYQAAKAAGPNAEEMRRLFRCEAVEELGHAAILAEAIVRLGGEPTTTPMEFDKPPCQKLMLEVDLVLEQADVERYLEHARLAADLEQMELQAELEAIASAEAAHAREMERVLGCLWPAGTGAPPTT
jgi:bacterioferritin (cytochrome b1)